jgi:hypothetical protein
MRRKQWAPLALVLLLASCAADGGSSGTGITSVEGNVATIQRTGAMASALTAATPTGLGGIAVTVEGTDAAAETNADGDFVVRGKFEGRATLRFERAADAVDADMTIVVPLGGTLTLHDVQIDVAAQAAAAANRHVVFDALISGADCVAGTLSLVSVSNEEGAYVYRVDLTTTFLHDAAATVVACEQLRAGDRVHVEAIARPDGTFGNADVEVERE